MSRIDELLDKYHNTLEEEKAQSSIEEPVVVTIRSDLLLKTLKMAQQAGSDETIIRLYNSLVNRREINEESDLDTCIFQATHFENEDDKILEPGEPIEEDDVTGVMSAPVPEEPLELVEEEDKPHEPDYDDPEFKKPSQEELNKISEDEEGAGQPEVEDSSFQETEEETK